MCRHEFFNFLCGIGNAKKVSRLAAQQRPIIRLQDSYQMGDITANGIDVRVLTTIQNLGVAVCAIELRIQAISRDLLIK